MLLRLLNKIKYPQPITYLEQTCLPGFLGATILRGIQLFFFYSFMFLLVSLFTKFGVAFLKNIIKNIENKNQSSEPVSIETV